MLGDANNAKKHNEVKKYTKLRMVASFLCDTHEMIWARKTLLV